MTDTREARLQLSQVLTEAEAARKPSMLFAPKWLQAALGNPGDAQFLQGLSYMQHNPKQYHPLTMNGHTWIGRSRQGFASFFTTPLKTLFSDGGVVARLHGLGLIHKDSLEKRLTLLRVDAERIAELALCCFALYTKKESEWLYWLSRNRALTASFAYVTASGARVHLFPGCGEWPKSYQQRTPYAPSVEDEALGRRLLSIWSQHRKDGKILDGNHPRKDGIHPCWDENHPSCGMESIQENDDNSIPLNDIEPVQRIELLEEGKEEPDFVRDNFVAFRSRLACVSGEELERLQPIVVDTASYFFHTTLLRPEVMKAVTARLIQKWKQHYEHDYRTPEQFLLAWGEFMEEHPDMELRTPEELAPHPSHQLWNAFTHSLDPMSTSADGLSNEHDRMETK